MRTPLTYEEQQLMALYNSAGTRASLIEELTEMRTYLSDEDADLVELTDSALSKLEAMTDAEFASLDLIRDFFPEEPDGE